MTRHVAFYARVSTPEQHVEPYLHALRQYATARELEVGASVAELARRFGIARGTVRKLVAGEVGIKGLTGGRTHTRKRSRVLGRPCKPADLTRGSLRAPESWQRPSGFCQGERAHGPEVVQRITRYWVFLSRARCTASSPCIRMARALAHPHDVGRRRDDACAPDPALAGTPSPRAEDRPAGQPRGDFARFADRGW